MAPIVPAAASPTPGNAPTTAAPAVQLSTPEDREKCVATLELAASQGVDVTGQSVAVKAQASKDGVSFSPAQLARIDKAVVKGQNAQSAQAANRTDFQRGRAVPVNLSVNVMPPPNREPVPVNLGNPAAKPPPPPVPAQVPALGVATPAPRSFAKIVQVSLQPSGAKPFAPAAPKAAPAVRAGEAEAPEADQRPLFGLSTNATPRDLAQAQNIVLAHDFVNGNGRRASLEKTTAAALAKGNTPRAAEVFQAYATTTAANLSQAAELLGLDTPVGRQLQANSMQVRRYATDAQTGSPEAIQSGLSGVQNLVGQSRAALPPNPLQPTLPPGTVNLTVGAPSFR